MMTLSTGQCPTSKICFYPLLTLQTKKIREISSLPIHLSYCIYKYLQSKTGFQVSSPVLSNWLVHLCFPRWENYSSAEGNMNV